jgi:hypothetical protein
MHAHSLQLDFCPVKPGIEKIGLKKTVQLSRARKAFREASYRSRTRSPVFWGHLRAPSPIPESMVNYRVTRAVRIVDKVFFPQNGRWHGSYFFAIGLC